MYLPKYKLIHSYEDVYILHITENVTIKYIDLRTNERSDGRGTDNTKAHWHFNLIERGVKIISDYAIKRDL